MNASIIISCSVHCRLVKYRYEYVGKVSLQTLTKISCHIDNQDLATKLSVLQRRMHLNGNGGDVTLLTMDWQLST